MTEYELLDLVAGESAQSATQFTLYLTVLFAYLVAAYFIGNKLRRPQVLILTSLYVFANGAQALGMSLTIGHVSELLERKREIASLTDWEQVTLAMVTPGQLP
jgi:hypothetical protein